MDIAKWLFIQLEAMVTIRPEPCVSRTPAYVRDRLPE
jgi:hypothetical protein